MPHVRALSTALLEPRPGAEPEPGTRIMETPQSPSFSSSSIGLLASIHSPAGAGAADENARVIVASPSDLCSSFLQLPRCHPSRPQTARNCLGVPLGSFFGCCISVPAYLLFITIYCDRIRTTIAAVLHCALIVCRLQGWANYSERHGSGQRQLGSGQRQCIQ